MYSWLPLATGVDSPTYCVSVSHGLWAAREWLLDEVVGRGSGHGRGCWPRTALRIRGSYEPEAILLIPGRA